MSVVALAPLLLQAAAPAPGSTPEIAVPVTREDWVRKPNPYDPEHRFPNLARWKGAGGEVELVCRVTDIGTVADCRVTKESPQGYGFGKAAMGIRSKIRLNPVPKGIKRWVLIPINYGKGDAPEALPPP